ncbi:unnamed protein product [Medioppia subpectinata]|uniref:G-patch domain-containing protein n=1 Tax=Medioppia subpectinata TaxID=1979941 RepID=A0A7R9KUC9_9ACAR|nr:unnamed protein product [Medioppia subpectinata]CAG2108641.1 unnamed protein product [Medioppia subpectinata]
MEKWAKTLNQKKDTSRTWIPSEPPVTGDSVQSCTADAGFTVLEQQVSNAETDTSVFDTFPKQVIPHELKANTDNTNHFCLSAYEIIRAEEKRLTDWAKLACLLCKRQFSTSELLTKHIQLSDLHKAGYRDRAKERRKKYGLPETPETNKMKTKYLTELEERSSSDTVVQSHQTPISNDNIGSKMLKAMGWTEGTGLGKANQGTKNIIQVEKRTDGIGLGMRSVCPAPGETYRDAVRRTMQLRFKEMHE